MRVAIATTLLALATLLAAACDGDDDIDIEGLVTRTPNPTQTSAPTRAPETATPTPTPTGTAPSSTPTPTPTATASPTATPTQAADGEQQEVEGSPFSSADVRSAVEANGYSFQLLARGDLPCPNTSVEALPRWSATLAGSDFGPLFALWFYPDEEAMREDWVAEPGERLQARTEGCDLPTGFNYWNANLVLVFVGVPNVNDSELSLVPPVPDMRDHPAVEAFLELAP